MEKRFQRSYRPFWKLGFYHRPVHQGNPSVPGPLIDMKRRMPHLQSGMPASFEIIHRSSKTEE